MARVTKGGPNTPVTISAIEDGVSIPTTSSGTITISQETPVKISYYDDASVTAFGRARVANPQTLFANHPEYNKALLLWNEKSTGSGSQTFNSTERLVDMAVVAANDEEIRQGKEFVRYQEGKGQLIFLTGIFAPGAADLTQEWGYYGDSNGFQLRLDGTSLQMVRSSTAGDANLSAGEEVVNQANWNIDSFGAGTLNPSGITLDIDKVQIFGIDFQALYAGRVRVGFDIDGIFYPAHAFNHANIISKPYIATANLPPYYRISAGAGFSGSATLKALCASVDSEGGSDANLGLPQAISNEDTLIGVTARRPILSIRPKAQFNSITNRIPILLEELVITSDAQTVYYEIIQGGDITGGTAPSWADVDSTYSSVEYDVTADDISGGIRIGHGYVAAGAAQGNSRPSGAGARGLASKVPIALDIDGNHPTSPLSDVISVVATSVPGSSTNVGAGLEWKELRL